MIAKFVLVSALALAGGQGETLTFNAVTSKPFDQEGNSEDNDFARWTPSGHLEMAVTNPNLVGQMQPGTDYYLCFWEASKGRPMLVPPHAVMDICVAQAVGFGIAVECLKAGRRVARKGWNGKGMYLWLNKGNAASFPDRGTMIDGVSDHLFELGGDTSVTRLPNINMRTATGATVTGWLASQTDILAEDWEVLPEDASPAPQSVPDDEL